MLSIQWPCVNSVDPGWSDNNFGSKIFKLIPQNSNLGACCEIVPRWLQQNLSNVKSTLVQVMAWCRQATSHYLNQCWPRFLTSYGITRPQWVNIWHWDTTPTCKWLTIAQVHWSTESPDLSHSLKIMHEKQWYTLCKRKTSWEAGPWFNVKMPSYQYRKSHYGDKMVIRSSYLHNVISYTAKMESLHWTNPLVGQYL